MPISRREFESGELDPILLLIEFFRSNADSAFTLNEIMTQVEANGMVLNEDEVRSILSPLVGQGKVESKTIHAVIYYIYKKSIGFKR